MSLNDAMDIITELAFEDTVIMVGHQPDLGDLIAHLLGTHAPTVHVRKASVAIFEMIASVVVAGRLRLFYLQHFCKLNIEKNCS